MTADEHLFVAPLVRHDVGRTAYRVVYLPAEIAAGLPFEAHPRLRVEGEIAGIPFEGAFQPSARGRYLMVNPETCRAAGLSLGDDVAVRFVVADQDAVSVPDELVVALLEDRDAMAAWEALTPGRRRGLCHHVASGRREETRAIRAEAIVAALAAGDPDALPGPPKRRR